MPFDSLHERVVPSHIGGLAGFIAGLENAKKSAQAEHPDLLGDLAEDLKGVLKEHLERWDSK